MYLSVLIALWYLHLLPLTQVRVKKRGRGFRPPSSPRQAGVSVRSGLALSATQAEQQSRTQREYGSWLWYRLDLTSNGAARVELSMEIHIE